MHTEFIMQAAGKSGAPPPARARQARDGDKRHATPLRVLIVEDDYLAASDAEAGLIEAGFEVVGIAASAEEAVRLAKAERPNVTVMDIRLAGQRDGVDAAIELYRDLGLRSIFATAHHDQHIKARAQPAAPLGWLPKPYTTDALVTSVDRAARELGKSK